MIVKHDRELLRCKQLQASFFSVIPLWLICPFLFKGSQSENLVEKYVALIFLLLLLVAILFLVGGIVCLKGQGKLIEINDKTFTYYSGIFGRKTLEIPLSEIVFVMKDMSTPMEDIEYSSTIRYFLKRVQHYFDYDASVGGRTRYHVLVILLKDGNLAVKYDKKLGSQSRKKRKYVSDTCMIQLTISYGEFFSDQEMNDYINERKNHDRQKRK